MQCKGLHRNYKLPICLKVAPSVIANWNCLHTNVVSAIYRTTEASCDIPGAGGEVRVRVEYAQQRRYVVGEPRRAPLAVATVFFVQPKF